ncbi:hypothetical protein GCM10011381_05250 [Klenkia taihuensis]|uniref:Uncharacterized protein n=1 Tax=Klenkia taihuensis TaxID=1225127 RepID=A0A1I1QLE1_9ACTN|nr:hypothetical protein [Klenkia taihuensis]GHE07708.1 hypothetical protein GCM10011381_05250 [Klenkia taihuensis]SFD22951.1 hypothetical protein SAMN05661030_2845 [Klenkia taihuensis]
MVGVFEIDEMALLTREVLRERSAALVAETCAWAVGTADRPHHTRRRGRLVATGTTVGVRAENGQLLGDEETGRLDLGDARPGSFRDALNMVDAEGGLYADRFDVEVLEPFVQETCALAGERLRAARPQAWEELADDVGEDPDDVAAVVRAGEWEAPLRIVAEHLVLAAIGDTPLAVVEAEGVPLSLVRAAEGIARRAAPAPPAPPAEIAGVLFLARAAVAGEPAPIPASAADRVLAALLAEGLERDEVLAVLADLPLEPDAERDLRRLAEQLPD